MPGRRPLRVLVIGGDATTWGAISAALGDRGSQIFAAATVDLTTLRHRSSDVDVVVLVVEPGDAAASQLGLVAESQLAPRTLVIADNGDTRTMTSVLDLGFGACLTRGVSDERLVCAIAQIADGGVFFDAPVATVLRSRKASTSPSLQAARALAHALELKDAYTGGHAERVTALALRLADAALGDNRVAVTDLEAAFLLHDVGKIGIPESILGKPGRLTETERLVLQTHPFLGECVVAPLGFPEVVRDVIRHHHERWDGTGYPDRLQGHDIPLAARIFSIADVLDAMTSLRPYRAPVSFEQAMREIMENAGSQFDPVLCALAEEVYLSEPLQLLDASLIED